MVASCVGYLHDVFKTDRWIASSIAYETNLVLKSSPTMRETVPSRGENVSLISLTDYLFTCFFIDLRDAPETCIPRRQRAWSSLWTSAPKWKLTGIAARVQPVCIRAEYWVSLFQTGIWSLIRRLLKKRQCAQEFREGKSSSPWKTKFHCFQRIVWQYFLIW